MYLGKYAAIRKIVPLFLYIFTEQLKSIKHLMFRLARTLQLSNNFYLGHILESEGYFILAALHKRNSLPILLCLKGFVM